jgi:predicted ABC-type exoprotein transport system permease subunit
MRSISRIFNRQVIKLVIGGNILVLALIIGIGAAIYWYIKSTKEKKNRSSAVIKNNRKATSC